MTADSYSGNHPGFIGIGRDASNAGSGSGTGSLVVNNALTLTGSTNFFEVGVTAFEGLNAVGELRAASGDVVVNQFANIGAHFGSTSDAGNVEGLVDLGAGSLSRDTDTLGGGVNIGFVSGGGHSGTAEGELHVQGLSNFASINVGETFGTAGSVTGLLAAGSDGISGGSLDVGRTYTDADATGTVTSDGSVVLNNSATVGVSSSTGTANGSLTVTSGDLNLGGSLAVGNNSGAGSAQGTFEQTGGNFNAGGVSVGQALRDSSGTAYGDAKLESVNGTIRSLQIGESFSSTGSSLGRVELLSTVLNVERFVAVGSGIAGGTGNGNLSLIDSTLTIGAGPESGINGDFFAGTGALGSVAEVSLERSLLEATDRLVLGAGAMLTIDIGGGTRITEYGAINADRAFLNGALGVNFDFSPIAADMVFDLVISNQLDGILGDFDSVNVFGLDSRYAVTFGVVTDVIANTQVEVYRLEISRSAVPEPGTLFLVTLALALLSFSSISRRKSWGFIARSLN